MAENITKLGVEFEGSELQKGIKDFEKYDKTVDEATKENKEFGKSSEKSAKSQKKLNTSLSNTDKLLGKMKTALGVYVGFQGFKHLTKTGVAFQQEMANLKAITGVAGDEFEAVKQKTRDLGAATKFTATEAAQAATEMGKLGLTSGQVVDSLDAVLSSASATGEGIADVAVVMVSSLNQFGLAATESARVSDVMAKSFSTSALDLEKFRESMKLVGPVANMNNISLEETTAQLAVLANSAISGSVAGTGLKNVMLKLANANTSVSKALAKEGIPNTASMTEKLAALSKMGLSATKTQQFFGRIALTSASILIKEAGAAATAGKSISEYEAALLDAAGTSEEMARIQIDTLGGAWDIMLSGLQELELSLFDTFGGEATDMVKKFTEGIAEFAEFVRKNKPLLIEFAEVVGVSFDAMAAGIGAAFDTLNALSQQAGLTTATTELNAFVNTVNSLNKNTNLLKNDIDILESIIQSDGGIFEGIQLSAQQAGSAIDILESDIEGNIDRAKKATEEYKKIGGTQKLKVIGFDVIQQEVKAVNDLKKAVDSVGGDDGKDKTSIKIKKTIVRHEGQFISQLEFDKIIANRKAITDSEIAASVAESALRRKKEDEIKTLNEKFITGVFERGSSETEILDKQFQQDLDLFTQYEEDTLGLEEYYSGLRMDIRDKEIDLFAENRKKENDIAISAMNGLLSSSVNFFGQLKGENEKYGKWYKGFALAQAGVNFGLALSQAWAKGWPVGAIEAAAAGIEFGTVFAQINSQKLNGGGEVQGPNMNRDTVPAFLTPGERVSSRSDRNEIKDLVSIVKSMMTNRGDNYTLNATAGTSATTLMQFRRMQTMVSDQNTPYSNMAA